MSEVATAMRIRYKRHFATLTFAVLIFWFVLAYDTVPGGVDRLLFYFCLIGALHATSLVVSLRDHKGWVSSFAFIALAAILSVATLFSIFLPAWLFSQVTSLRQDPKLFLSLGLASAFGASAYWLVIRCFWLKSLRFLDLIMTAAICAAAAVLSWLGAGMITPTTGRWNPGDVIPTAAWWVAFSLSLLLSEERVQKTDSLTP